jgi:hypothetical protein
MSWCWRRRSELERAVLRRNGSGEEHRGKLCDGSRERPGRGGAEREEASDHRQPAGEGDRLPEREGDGGSTGKPRGA